MKKDLRLRFIILIIIFIFITNLNVSANYMFNENKNYNREKAADYAKTWATTENPAYHNYVNEGGDCTNFVSQVLRAGGINFVGNRASATSIKSWFYYSANLPNRTPTWTAAQPFSLHFGKGSKRVYEFKEYSVLDALNNWDEIYMDLSLGDIVQYARQNKIAFHSQAITSKFNDSEETIYICQHSNTMENFRADVNLRYYLLGKPNDYLFYTYIVKKNDKILSKEKVIDAINNITEEEYRKKLYEALDIIKLSLSETRFENEIEVDEKTSVFIKVMEEKIKTVEYHIDKRGKTYKDLLEILIDRNY